MKSEEIKTLRQKLDPNHKYGGGRYRYFHDDPEGKGRGPGYYRKAHGVYFKKGETAKCPSDTSGSPRICSEKEKKTDDK